jgi:hypothetical protein
MNAGPRPIDRSFQPESISRGTTKIPIKFTLIFFDLLQITKFAPLSIMPEHGFAK